MLKWEYVSGVRWTEVRLYIPAGLWSINHNEGDDFFLVTFKKKGTCSIDNKHTARTFLEAQGYIKRTITSYMNDEIARLLTLRQEVEDLPINN